MTADRTRTWILLSPFLFVLHEAEEYATALPWLLKHASLVPSAIKGIIPDTPAFIAYAGAMFLVVYAIAGALAIRSRPRSIAWMILAILITARLENAVLHAIESFVLRQYTPGVLTAVLLVLPITLYLLRQFIRDGVIRRSWLGWIIPAAFLTQSLAIGAMLLIG